VLSNITKVIEKTYYKKKYQEIFNIGNNAKNITVAKIIKIAREYFPLKINLKKMQTIDKKNLNLNCSKIYKKLKIRNKYSTITAIENTFEWYKNFHIKKIKAKILCDNEILKYENENI
jgi:nucleoside-diphosphate-sugar epimerase